METIIYHNPRCSKSRQTLQLIESRDIQPKIVEYLKTPPSQNEIKKILKTLKISAHELLRTKEKAYAQLNLSGPDLSEEVIIDAMHNHPELIERPIVVHGEKAIIGRPPENVLKIL